VTEPLLLPARQAFAELGIGRDHGYELVHAGKLRAIHVGERKLLIPRSELAAFVERELAAFVDRESNGSGGSDRHD
jgi:excisionase family DNA binding protein